MKTTLLAAGLLVLAFLAPAVCAQGRSEAPRVTDFPANRPDGPWGGAATFRIAGGGDVSLTLRLSGPDGIVRETPVRRLPVDATLDLSQVPGGEYSLQLVEARPDVVGQVVWERWPVTVQPGAPGGALIRARAAPSPDAARFVRRFPDGQRPAVGGVLELSLDSVPARGALIATVEQGGRVLARIGADGAGRLRWDSRQAADGSCQVILTLVDLDGASAPPREMDRLELTVRNARPVAPALPSRGGPGRIALARDGGQLIATLSRMAGDPWPRVAAAQWALESGWGKSPSGRNNYFGIKSWDGTGTLVSTREWEGGQTVRTTARFADYPSLYDGVAARVAFLRKGRYAGYWSASSEEEACRFLQSAGYATDPGYAQKLMGLVGRF